MNELRHKLKEAVYAAVPRSRLVQRGRADRKQVALTFDDGPNEMTSAYLDLLDELGVRATFFVLGLACVRMPELTREYIRRGHQIASHGYDHTRFTKLDWRSLDWELRKTAGVLGPQPTRRPWVRPPYGTVDARVLGQLLLSGSMIALWSLDPMDYEIKDPQELARRCAPKEVAPGEIILLHEGQQWTLEALPLIVKPLKEAGYEFVTMAEMLSEA